MSVRKDIICDICGDVKTDKCSDWGQVPKFANINRESNGLSIISMMMNNEWYNNVHICNRCLTKIVNDTIHNAFRKEFEKQQMEDIYG